MGFRGSQGVRGNIWGVRELPSKLFHPPLFSWFCQYFLAMQKRGFAALHVRLVCSCSAYFNTFFVHNTPALRKKKTHERQHIGLCKTFRFKSEFCTIMRRIVINVKQKRRASDKCVGDESGKYKLFGIMAIVGSPTTFAIPKGVLGADMAENHWTVFACCLCSACTKCIENVGEFLTLPPFFFLLQTSCLVTKGPAETQTLIVHNNEEKSALDKTSEPLYLPPLK